jgi:CheY-like chemotaxis protein
MKKILIADDDLAIMDAISIMLEYEGYEVLRAPDAAILLTMNNEFPDLVLLDIWMSGIDGRDICRYLKRNKATSKIPVVLISASREIENSAKQAGADDFLAKPFELNDLLKKIERVMLA